MFAFSQVQPETTGSIQDMEVPMSTYLKSSIDQAIHTDPIPQISRWSELQAANDNDQPKLSAEEANKQYGMEGFKFEEPITDEAASLLADRHKAQMDNNFSLSNDNHSLLAKAAGTTVGMIASMIDPVNLALMFMPVVGEATKLGPVESASELGMLGRGGYLRENFNAGLITRQELQQTIPTMPKLAESLIQGASYMSLAEGPKQFFAASEKEDVGDPMANILEGIAFAGGMHLGLSALFKLWPHIANSTKVALMGKAMNDFVKGNDISVHELAGADEAVAAHQVDEANSEAPWPSSWKQEDLLTHQEAYHQNLQNIFNSALDKIQKGYDTDRAQAAREIDELRSKRAPTGPTEPPVVPETGADPRQTAFSSSLDEIRQKGARTTAQVQALFPEIGLSRQEAAALRRQAWGEDEVKQKQQDNIKQLLDNAEQANKPGPGQKALNRKQAFANMPNPFEKSKETEQQHDAVTPQDKTITPVEKQSSETKQALKRDSKGRFVKPTTNLARMYPLKNAREDFSYLGKDKAIMNEIQHEAESFKPQPKAIETAVQCAGQQIL